MSEQATSAPAVKPQAKAKRRMLLGVIPVIAVLGSGWVYLNGGRYVETENAYLKANKTAVTAQVSGVINSLNVSENQSVEKGQLLFSIDNSSFKVAVAQAQAQLDQVRINLMSQKAAYVEKQAEIELAKSQLAYNRKEADRQANLSKQNFVSASQYDATKQAVAVSELQLATLEKDLIRLREALGGNVERPIEQHPSYLSAQAALAQANLNLEHVAVYAPSTGVVTKVPTNGEFVAAGSTSLVLIGGDKGWIEANFPEKDLAHLAPGQSVDIEIDAYPNRHLIGHVASISPATGSEFSVIPAQNATGNWVKITQRVPVRIEFDTQQDLPPLRSGLSAIVTVDTHHQRQLAGFSL
ncbi:HlyD family secretion protein [Maribrevibacterium harenarium]|uniref:HlyD family secretion protein n=1 Tax=Maribrevibacterium harenarium TaxID=2589817 RepID=A0A501X0N4_9GAMM|nr:HlyD family secretion protein [Maribrevibacterium harenarium]TPE53391.1 HlyD family secretion protein [Maribrevibacterium harenarium]